LQGIHAIGDSRTRGIRKEMFMAAHDGDPGIPGGGAAGLTAAAGGMVKGIVTEETS